MFGNILVIYKMFNVYPKVRGWGLLTNIKCKTHKNVTRVQVIDKIIRISQIRANITISNMLAG